MGKPPNKHRLKAPALPPMAAPDPVAEAIEATEPPFAHAPTAPAWPDQESMRALSTYGIELAITAPDVRIIGSDYGKVPWTLIERARATCEAMGIDWRGMRSQAIALAKGGALMTTDIEQ